MLCKGSTGSKLFSCPQPILGMICHMHLQLLSSSSCAVTQDVTMHMRQYTVSCKTFVADAAMPDRQEERSPLQAVVEEQATAEGAARQARVCTD